MGAFSFAAPSSDGSFLLPLALLTEPIASLPLLSAALLLAALVLLSSCVLLPRRLRQSAWQRLRCCVAAVCDAVAWQWRLLVAALSPLTWLRAQSSHPQSVHLLAVTTFTAPDDWRVSTERFRVIAGHNFRLPSATVEFCARVIAKSGLGESTAFPRTSRSTP